MSERLLIGVICSEPHMERSAKVLEGIIAQAFRSNCDIAVISPLFHIQFEFNNFRAEEKYIYRLILSERFDGFIYDRRFILNDKVAEYTDMLLKKTHKPVMMVDGSRHSFFENTASDDRRPFEKLCIIREKIRNNPQYEWSIDSICKEFHVSKSYLQKSYKSCFGSSIIDELIHFRIDMAKELLEETELSITEIAEQCGYSSYIYFARQFKKVENIIPSAYRELKKRKHIASE